MDKRTIIVVDDNAANLTACKKALKDTYDVFPLPSAEKMFELLEKVTPDLILLDVEMPGMNGYEAMARLKKDERRKDIPVIFLSAMDDAQSEMEGLDLGAVDYIYKPFVNALLIKRIDQHITIIESKRELTLLNESVSEDLSKPVLQEAVKDLQAEIQILTRMGHAVREPLSVIIQMLETAIQSTDMNEIKNCLGRADIESRLILEIIDDSLDADNREQV